MSLLTELEIAAQERLVLRDLDDWPALTNGRPVPAPQLHLQGAWLQRAGFHIGVPVKVYVSHGRLVIEPDRDRAPQTEVLARVAQVTEGGLSKRDLDSLIRRLKRDRID